MKRGIMVCATRPAWPGAACRLCAGVFVGGPMAELYAGGEVARVCWPCVGALRLVLERPGVVLSLDDPIDREAAAEWGRPAPAFPPGWSGRLRPLRRDFGEPAEEGGER